MTHLDEYRRFPAVAGGGGVIDVAPVAEKPKASEDTGPPNDQSAPRRYYDSRQRPCQSAP